MNFLNLAEKRESVRGYTDAPVEKEKIVRCLEAVRLTPSACNSQPWRFVVVTDAKKARHVAKETVEIFSGMNKWAKEAPVMVAVVATKPKLSSQLGATVKNRPFWLMDVGMAAEHFCLQAAEEGLGTCMMGWFHEGKVKKILGLSGKDKIVLMISLGYPRDDVPRKKVRKSIEVISQFIEGED